MKDEIIAIIPVRGGSKSIPDKNIRDFAGKPLIYWVARAANDSNIIKKVIVSTDSERIKNTVECFNFERVRVVGRSKKSTFGHSPSEMALMEVARKYTFKDLVFLQVTNPFTRNSDIDNAYDLYRKGKYDGVLSAVPQRRFIWKRENDGAYSFNYDYKKRPMRQEFEELFVENGALYITSRKNLLRYENRLSGKIGIYPMPEYSYFELDEPDDWDIAEAIFLRKRIYLEHNFNLKRIKLLVLDVDGVLTDGKVYVSGEGEKMVKFSRIDGKGIELFLRSKRKVVVISSEDSLIVKRRLGKLKIKDYFLGVSDKWQQLKKYLTGYNIALEDTAFVGDDIQDLEIIDKVGFSACPSNAAEIIKSRAHYICQRRGGDGAVREVIDLILMSKQGIRCEQ